MSLEKIIGSVGFLKKAVAGLALVSSLAFPYYSCLNAPSKPGQDNVEAVDVIKNDNDSSFSEASDIFKSADDSISLRDKGSETADSNDINETPDVYDTLDGSDNNQDGQLDEGCQIPDGSDSDLSCGSDEGVDVPSYDIYVPDLCQPDNIIEDSNKIPDTYFDYGLDQCQPDVIYDANDVSDSGSDLGLIDNPVDNGPNLDLYDTTNDIPQLDNGQTPDAVDQEPSLDVVDDLGMYLDSDSLSDPIIDSGSSDSSSLEGLVADGSETSIDSGIVDSLQPDNCTPKNYYIDNDKDGYGDMISVTACENPGPLLYVENNIDCNDNDSTSYPGADEICDGKDNNCNGETDEGLLKTCYADTDLDGYGNLSDSAQLCECSNGYVEDHTDCDDSNNKVHPSALELCNSVDDDCDGQIDEGLEIICYKDQDGDSYGDISQTVKACVCPAGYVLDSTDCNDNDKTVYPGAKEICNSKDDNCNGQVDEGVKITCYKDNDKDSYGDAKSSVEVCECSNGLVADKTDCNDNDSNIHPGLTEICDGKDNDCDGLVDIVSGAVLTKTEKCDVYNTNLNGTQNYKCQNSSWVVVGACNDPDECSNGSSHQQDCISACGQDKEVVLCSEGKWGVVPDSCNAPQPKPEDLNGDGLCTASDLNGVDDDCNGVIDDICYSELGGIFQMGCDGTIPAEANYCQIDPTVGNLNPKHEILLSNFRILKYPVTVGSYKKCVEANNCTPPMKIGTALDSNYYYNELNVNKPVVNVAYGQAKQYCTFAGGRLATEAELESAAGGYGKSGDGYIFTWGDDIKTGTECSYVGNSMACSLGGPVNVGSYCSKIVKESTVCDYTGNVMSWVSDWFAKSYPQNSVYQDPTGPSFGTNRSVRGSSFNSKDLNGLAIWYRNSKHPESYSDDLGFYCVIPTKK